MLLCAMHCPHCHRQFSFWFSFRILYPFRYPCPSCQTVLTLNKRGAQLYLFAVVMGAVIGASYIPLRQFCHANEQQALGIVFVALLVGAFSYQYFCWRLSEFIVHPKPQRGRKRKKWILISIAALPILIILFHLEEDWRGNSQWMRVASDLRGRNEPLDLKDLLPPRIPDDQNVAAAPIFAELLTKDWHNSRLGMLELKPVSGGKLPSLASTATGQDVDLAAWQYALTGKKNPETAAQDVLDALNKKDSFNFIPEIKEALNRPHLRWPIEPTGPLYMENTSYLGPVIGIAKFLALKATAEIDLGQSDQAFNDVCLLLSLSHTTNKGWALVDYLASVGIDSIGFGPIQYGLEKHRWSAGQLQTFEDTLSDIKPLSSAQRAIRAERCQSIYITYLPMRFYWETHWFDQSTTIYGRRPISRYGIFPCGWKSLDRAFIAESLQRYVIDPMAPSTGRIDVSKVKAGQELLNSLHFFPFKIMHFWGGTTLSPLLGVVQPTAEFQARINEAVVACALASFRLKNDKLPNSLDELTPDFLSTLPVDPVNGDPLRYVLKDNQNYVLYSVGWNEKDDGGVTDASDKKNGDWVWASKPELYRIAR